MLSYIDKYEAAKPVHAEYAAIGWKKKKEKFAESHREELEAVQADVKILRDVRHWLNQVLPSEQYRQTAEQGKKPSVQESLKGRQERIRQEQAGKQKPPRTQKQQNMEL